MITLATLVLVFALVLISVFLLASSIRWLITGRKPTLVLFAQAYQRWKHMARGTANVPKNDGNIIDAEVKEISKDNQLR
jgi:predicted alpha/beta-fold hydrolase